jgi:serine/threonine protein kinase
MSTDGAGVGARSLGATNELDLLAGRYEVHEPLGIGSVATVHRAHDRRLGVWRAAKILHPFVSDEQGPTERFLDEARVMARIEHPNILRLYDFGRDRGRYWAIFELAERGGLPRLVSQNGPLPVEKALRIGFQLAGALAVAHAHAVVHRDVRPANVLVGFDGAIRLADFGVARLKSRVTQVSESDNGFGNSEYTAPEARDEFSNADAASDVWSTGATILFLLTGRPPSWPVPVVGEDLPSATARLLRTALARDREYRYTSSEWLAREIAAAYDGHAASIGLPLRSDAWLETLSEQLNAARTHAGLVRS